MSFESAEATTRHVVPLPLERRLMSVAGRASGIVLLAGLVAVWLSLMTWSVADPSLTHATSGTPRNVMGALGAIVSDLLLQTFGLAAVAVLASLLFLGVELVRSGAAVQIKARVVLIPVSAFVVAGAMSALPVASGWPLHHDYGGIIGDTVFALTAKAFGFVNSSRGGTAAGLVMTAAAGLAFVRSLGLSWADLAGAFRDWGTASASVRSPQMAEVQSGSVVDPIPTPGRAEPRWDFAGPVSGPLPMTAEASTTLPRFIDRGGEAGQTGFADGFARAVVSVRNAARRGVQVVQEQKVRMAESFARHAAASHGAQPVAATHPNYGQPYAPAGGRAGYGQAGGFQGMPHGMQPAQRPPQDPRATTHGAHYVPPHPPAYDYRAPARGPAAQYAPHPSRDPFDVTTEEASRAIARRFAPAQPTYDYDAYPAAAAAVAPPAHVAAPVHAVQPLPPAPSAPAQKAAPPVPAPAARPAPLAAPAVVSAPPAPQGTRRNALFGGLTFRHQGGPAFKAPPLALLKKPVPNKAGPEFTQTVLRGNARLLEDVLADFGVKGEVRDIRPGPVVTLFEMEPARGTKSSRVIGLADDIARSMSATAVRVAVVPGRNAIGIELPNAHRETVLLRELLEAEAFKAADAALPMAIGKSIGGDPVVADLARMPHLLVAGTTGSGKSVGVNAMILSLLYRLSPDDCRFLMIDPKMLELSVYNGIPHLLTPVVTDPQKAVAALNWVVGEMEERYKRMSKLSVRNIDVYNNRVRNAKKRGEMIARTVQTGFDRRTGEAIYEQESLALEPMPYIVVVIDEFADLMMVAGKEVEASVQRLAQMARAAGIHLIMATQRPSVDVITGTIKANFPTRISFKVTSKIDSRTILNEQGAEQLLGQGDMLFTGGGGQIARVHGAFVSDEEVEAIAGHLRQQGQPQYVEGITDTPEPAAKDPAGEERGHSEEDLYDRAVAVVLRDRKASTSYIQRRLSIGYNRAADLIERMEREGVVGPANNVGKRDILGAAAVSDMPERDADAA